MKSREGNEIPPIDAPIRSVFTDKGLCFKCVHVLDECQDLRREWKMIESYCAVKKCNGFDEVTG